MTLEIKEGGYYRAGNGKIYGPIARRNRDRYPWTDGKDTWTSEGFFFSDRSSQLENLVEQIEPVALKEPADAATQNQPDHPTDIDAITQAIYDHAKSMGVTIESISVYTKRGARVFRHFPDTGSL